jgi:Protein of unknown function (DUF2934)
MERDVTERIRERAYELWVASGSPQGKSEINWLAAEKEVLATQVANKVRKSASRKSAKGKGLGPRTAASKAASKPAL